MSLLAFASGFAKATGAAAIKEDERRLDLSKDAFKESMKRRDAALKIAKEQQAEFQKERDYINSVRGMKVDGYVVSAAEASELYGLTEGDVTKIEDVVKSGLIKIRNAGTLEEVKGDTAWSPEMPKMSAEDESSILFGSTTAGASKMYQEQVKDIDAVQGASKFKVSGVERGEMKTAEDKALKNVEYNYTVEVTDKDGKTKTVAAFLADGKLYTYDKGQPRLAGEVYDKVGDPRKQPTRRVDEPNYVTTQTELLKNIKKDTTDAIRKGADSRALYENGTKLYQRMYEVGGADDALYSTFAKTVGAAATAVTVEFAGFNLTNSKEKTLDSDQMLATVQSNIDKFRETNNKAKLLEAYALEAAIMHARATQGAGVLSDFDVKTSLARFLPKSGKEFMAQAASNLRAWKDMADTARDAVASDFGVQNLKNVADPENTGVTDIQRQVATDLLSNIIGAEIPVSDMPEFTVQYRNVADEVAEPAEGEAGVLVDTQIKMDFGAGETDIPVKILEAPVSNPENIKVTIDRDTKTVGEWRRIKLKGSGKRAVPDEILQQIIDEYSAKVGAK